MTFSSFQHRYRAAHYWLPGAVLLLLSIWVFLRLWTDNSLHVTYVQSVNGGFQVFYDLGTGHNENDSFRYRAPAAQTRNSLNIPIPLDQVRSLRIDPVDNDGKVVLYDISAKHRGNFFRKSLVREQYPLVNGIRSMSVTARKNLAIRPVRAYPDAHFVIDNLPPAPAAWIFWAKLFGILAPLWVIVLLSMRYAQGLWNRIACIIGDGVDRVVSDFGKKDSRSDTSGARRFPWWFHTVMILIVIGVLLFSRSISLPFPGYHADDVHKWLHGKMLIGQIPLSEWSWDHHTARLSTMVVIWLVQLIFGTDPMNYYLVPLIANLGLFIGMYWLGCKVTSPIPSLVGTVMLILLSPSQFYQLMPSPFVAAFVVFAAIYYYKAVENKEADRSTTLFVTVAAVFVFLGYLSWIGALFFMPAFAWLFLRKTSLKSAVLFLSILLGAYFIETALYAIFAGIPTGRLGIILGNYFEEVDYRNVWMDFFRRYNYLPGLTKTFILAFIYSLPAVLLLHKWIPGKLLSFVLFPIAFLFLLTFGVKSIHPLSLFLGHDQPRYAYACLPFVYLSLAGFGWVPFYHLGRALRYRIFRNPILLIVVGLLFAGHFVNQFWLSRDPSQSCAVQKQRLDDMVKMCEIARADDMMVVEMDHEHAKGIKFYNDMLYPRASQTPSPKSFWLNLGGRWGMVVLPAKDVSEVTPEMIDAYKHRNICLIFEEMPVSARFETVTGLLERGIRRKAQLWIGNYGETLPWVVKLLPKPGKMYPIQQKSLEAEGNAWSKDGGDFAKNPGDSDYWGSWSGNDEQTGKLILRMEVDHRRKALRIPIRTGPNTENLTITIKDMNTGEKFAVVEEITTQIDVWGFLDIPMVALDGTDEIEVVFEDAGDIWGSWMAIAIPGWI